MNYTFYKIYSKDPAITECYIGSTEDIEGRKTKHKSSCNNINDPIEYNYKVYQYIRSNGGWDNFEFEIIDTIIFSETDRLLYENKLMKLYGSTLNARRAIITKEERKEYDKEYRETHREYFKEYYETHKEEINNKRNKKIVCEVCGGKYTVNNKSKHLKSKKHITNQLYIDKQEI